LDIVEIQKQFLNWFAMPSVGLNCKLFIKILLQKDAFT
jgi:hypothetical protein